MPSWRQNMTVGEWRQVSGTALSSAPMAVRTYPDRGNTGPASKVDTWSGYAVDTRDSSLYSVANGGHQDYAGNEVNRLRLSDSAPTWAELRESSPSSAIPTAASGQNVTHYSDGRPASRHTYYGVTLNEVSNRAMLFTGSGWGNQGGALHSADSFNLSNNSWDAKGTVPEPGADFYNQLGWTWVEVKSTGDVYGVGNFRLRRWRQATNSWTTMVTGGPNGQYTASAHDSSRNRILFVGGEVGDHHVYDIGSNTMTAITLSGPNASNVINGKQMGMVYVPALDAYLVRDTGAGGTIYRINASTWSVDTLTTSAGGGIPATDNGVWRRFLYVPGLKGIIYLPTYTGNVWFLRTF